MFNGFDTTLTIRIGRKVAVRQFAVEIRTETILPHVFPSELQEISLSQHDRLI